MYHISSLFLLSLFLPGEQQINRSAGTVVFPVPYVSEMWGIFHNIDVDIRKKEERWGGEGRNKERKEGRGKRGEEGGRGLKVVGFGPFFNCKHLCSTYNMILIFLGRERVYSVLLFMVIFVLFAAEERRIHNGVAVWQSIQGWIDASYQSEYFSSALASLVVGGAYHFMFATRLFTSEFCEVLMMVFENWKSMIEVRCMLFMLMSDGQLKFWC